MADVEKKVKKVKKVVVKKSSTTESDGTVRSTTTTVEEQEFTNAHQAPDSKENNEPQGYSLCGNRVFCSVDETIALY